MGVGGDGPVVEGVELGLAADELVGDEVAGFGVEGGRCGDGVFGLMGGGGE